MATYITTPIYYVNDRPHIGHCYTTLLADVMARAARLTHGPDHPVFFLTGTDEHAEKVVTRARENHTSPQHWADLNAQRFRDAFAFMRFTHNDFVRTTEPRHKLRASAYIQRLVDSGDITLGDYSGWWDESQEEYVPENTAREHDYKSPVTKRPLVKRTEQNYFFDLPKHTDWLRHQIESDALRILPDARKNEVLGRIKQGLQRVPVSRKINPADEDWGIRMPNDPAHRVYVWIEALCNYLTVVDNTLPPDTTPADGGPRRAFWPPLQHPAEGPNNRPPSITHLMAKDILWFHAVIWPAMLHALGERPPTTIYAHAYWIAEGQKMSKSLGNFIEIDQLRAYADRFSLDAVRWYLTTQGPGGPTDADFAHARFIDVYNTDLANGIGNCASRVANMFDKYFAGAPDRTCDGRFGFPTGVALQTALAARAATGKPAHTPDQPHRTFDFAASTARAVAAATDALHACRLDDMLAQGLALVREVDDFISYTAPFTLAKQLDQHEHGKKALATILYSCAEAVRIASLLLWPAMPDKMQHLWQLWHCHHLADPTDATKGFAAPLARLAQWTGPHSIKPGQPLGKGDALFMRADPADPAPSANATAST